MAHTRLLASALLLAVAGCSPSEPPHWAEGGATLSIPRARWDRPDGDVVEIQANGRVFEGGHLRFVIDRVGRVTDDDYDAFAVLLPDGHVVGTDSRALGYVGINNASPPFSDQAWLGLQSDGSVIFYEPNGDRSSQGRWSGCEGASRRACTLVTQIFAMRHYRLAPTSGVSFGVGVGVGIGF